MSISYNCSIVFPEGDLLDLKEGFEEYGVFGSVAQKYLEKKWIGEN